MDEELTMNQFLGAKKATLVLQYIAEKTGWKFVPEDACHFVGVRRLDRPDFEKDRDNPVQEFRVWYQSVRREFYFNYGSYTYHFNDEPVNANKYKISDILKRMIEFDERARRIELYTKKQAISDAAQLYEA